MKSKMFRNMIVFMCLSFAIFFKICFVDAEIYDAQIGNLPSETTNNKKENGSYETSRLVEILESTKEHDLVSEYCPKNGSHGYTDNYCISYCWWNGFQGGRCTRGNVCLCDWEGMLDTLGIPKRNINETQDDAILRSKRSSGDQLQFKFADKGFSDMKITVEKSGKSEGRATDANKSLPDEVERSEDMTAAVKELHFFKTEIKKPDLLDPSTNTTFDSISKVENMEKVKRDIAASGNIARSSEVGNTDEFVEIRNGAQDEKRVTICCGQFEKPGKNNRDERTTGYYVRRDRYRIGTVVPKRESTTSKTLGNPKIHQREKATNKTNFTTHGNIDKVAISMKSGNIERSSEPGKFHNKTGNSNVKDGKPKENVETEASRSSSDDTVTNIEKSGTPDNDTSSEMIVSHNKSTQDGGYIIKSAEANLNNTTGNNIIIQCF